MHFEEVSGRSGLLLRHAVTVIADDVDAHFERAEREGTALLGAPKDQPWGSATTLPSIRRNTSESSPPRRSLRHTSGPRSGRRGH